MPLPTWPEGLPSRPLRDGFSAPDWRPPDASEVEDGPDIIRKSSYMHLEQIVYPLYFTAAQYAVWKAFADDTLKQATSHFMMPVFIEPNVFATRRVYIKGGRWRPAEPYRLGWRIRPTLCVFPAS